MKRPNVAPYLLAILLGLLSLGFAEDTNSSSQISFSFKNAEPQAVFEALAKKLGKNVLIHSEVSVKQMTFGLEKVEPLEALDLICRAYKLTYTTENQTIIIYSRESLLSEGFSRGFDVETVFVKNRSVKDVFGQIAISSSGDPKSGGGARLTDSKGSGSGGVALGSGSAISPTGGLISFDEKDNSITISDSKTNIQVIKTLIDRLDRRLKSVLIEAKIVSVELKDEQRFGINWSMLGTMQKHSANFNFPANSGGTTLRYVTDPATSPLKIFDLSVQFDVAIDAIAKKNQVKILSNPRIFVMSGEESRIVVGKTIPYQVTTYTDKGLPVQDSKFIQTGIKLIVTPMVFGEMVKLKIHPESSKPTQDTPGSAPVVDTSEADSTIYVRDGESVVLGGLIEQDKSQLKSGTPFISKIPIIGFFFSSTERRNNRSEIVVFINVKII